MANICENAFFASSDDERNIETIFNFFNGDDDVSFLDGGESDWIECYFESKWSFPEEKMKELFEMLPNKDDIYMRCLSVEHGCEYVAYYLCKGKDGWYEKY